MPERSCINVISEDISSLESRKLPFDKNGIESTERLFTACSKSRSGAKSVRSKMIVQHRIAPL